MPAHAIALFYTYYNFGRIHQMLKTETPAMSRIMFGAWKKLRRLSHEFKTAYHR